MITRYFIDSGLDPCPNCLMTPDEGGEWVRWEDVKEILLKFERATHTILERSEELNGVASVIHSIAWMSLKDNS